MGFLVACKNEEDPIKNEGARVVTTLFIKGDISRFFIFHCKFLLYVGFYVFIKIPDHFPQCSVIK